MLYIKHKKEQSSNESVSDGVEYFCKFCGNVKPLAQKQPKLISKVSYQDNHDVEDLVGGDMINDVTLPHVHDIKCKKGDNCQKPKGEKDDVILMRYDTNNSKYMYYCTYCQIKWK
tara:strand:- start:475 stop:819 length:345 start_codon:yes stop_codon:yes gene_type:complete